MGPGSRDSAVNAVAQRVRKDSVCLFGWNVDQKMSRLEMPHLFWIHRLREMGMLEGIYHLRPTHPHWGLTCYQYFKKSTCEGSQSILEELCSGSALGSRAYRAKHSHSVGKPKCSGNSWMLVSGARWQHSTVRGSTDRNSPPWLGKRVATCMSCLTAGGPGKEHWTKKLPRVRRTPERSKERGDARPYVLPASQNPPCWSPSWLSDAQATRKEPKSQWLARDNPETKPISINPETASHVAEQFSWVLLPYCSVPGRPFLIKSLALSACVSPWKIHFQVLDKSPLLGPGSGGVPLPATQPPKTRWAWLTWWGAGSKQKSRCSDSHRPVVLAG